MEFWGIEVKAGEPFVVEPLPGQLVHISQAALGETTGKEAKGAKNIPLRLKIDDRDLIIGSLKPEERTQVSFDLVFEKKFVLSHDWKLGSIYFAGYLAEDPISDAEYSSDDFSSDESEDEKEKDSPAAPANGAKGGAKGAAAAAVSKSETKKKKDTPVADSADDDVDSDDISDDDTERSLGGDFSSDDDLLGDDSEEDESESEEEELPKLKVQQSKKRPAPAESAAPVAAKKAKSIPEKTGNKKGQNAAAPSKAPAGKNASGNKSKESPKSGGSGGLSGKKGKRGGK